MNLSSSNMLQIDTALCRAFAKEPGETLVKAAWRMKEGLDAGPVREAACLLLYSKADPWDRMARAYEILRRNGFPIQRVRKAVRMHRCVECLAGPGRGRVAYPAVSGGLCALHASRKRRAEKEESP